MYDRLYNLLLEASGTNDLPRDIGVLGINDKYKKGRTYLQNELKSRIRKRLGKKPRDTTFDDIHSKQSDRGVASQQHVTYDTSRQDNLRDVKDRKQKAKDYSRLYPPDTERLRTRKPSVKSQKRNAKRNAGHAEAIKRLRHFPEK